MFNPETDTSYILCLNCGAGETSADELKAPCPEDANGEHTVIEEAVYA
jgi:hypothetical protein